ncbi:hypothetical protein [Nitrosomonas marina]|uniref:Uncharacterized protein n=1 Tax=Nitrosomonas marina TaxID=917 RepID=A0A1H8IS57_9PROT|nr:hypothetical protein [Nitrosomonas marina]SEN71211.1 hypothetical protein SAMN05216325_13911 [Nitrosomonas marina]
MAKDKSTPTKSPVKRRRGPRFGNVDVITPKMRSDKAIKEWRHFIDTASEAEKKVVRHLKMGIGAVALMREIRRLLGESKAKCEIIPFPHERVRKSADSVAGRKPKIGSAVIDLQRGV